MIKFIIYINVNIIFAIQKWPRGRSQAKNGWELGMQCKELEEGGFDPFIRTPNSSVTQCNYNPGLNSWDKNTISCQNDAFFLSLLPPSAVLVLYIQVLFQQNQHILKERGTAEIGSYNNIDPSFLRGTM